jgi:hypothetical protein
MVRGAPVSGVENAAAFPSMLNSPQFRSPGVSAVPGAVICTVAQVFAPASVGQP